MADSKIGGILFGTAGIPHSAHARTTQAGIDRVAELGLGCLEVEFVRGVKMTQDTALASRKSAASKGIALTAHAPYFMNLNAKEPAKVEASKERLLQTARVASILGARGVVFHPAFYLGDPPAEVYVNVRKQLEEVRAQLNREGNGILLRAEVMGKESQFGSIEEILNLSADIEGVAPCLDFSHCHARTGEANSHQEFASILEQIEAKLGRQALDDLHIHISGIDYGKKGEIKHLLLRDSDFRYKDLLRVLRERDAKGLIICESPNLEEDALLLQQSYLELSAQ